MYDKTRLLFCLFEIWFLCLTAHKHNKIISVRMRLCYSGHEEIIKRKTEDLDKRYMYNLLVKLLSSFTISLKTLTYNRCFGYILCNTGISPSPNYYDVVKWRQPVKRRWKHTISKFGLLIPELRRIPILLEIQNSNQIVNNNIQVKL